MLRGLIATVWLLSTLTGMTETEFVRQIASKHLGATRTVRIHLPASYLEQPARRFPVLYLHDGQNVFSSSGPHCCFGWGSWQIDKTAQRLADEGRIREIILVAIDNSRFRYQEYRGPVADPTADKKDQGEKTRYERYAAFLTKELKPLIDREYRTQKDAKHTGIMGSSLGGICSLALAWDYPKIFGCAASLSGAFQIEKRYFLKSTLEPYRGKPKPMRIYLDSGTIDFTGDDDGRRHTTAVADQLRRLGWKDGKNLQHFVDLHTLSEVELEKASLPRHKWKEAAVSQHNEFYWRLRAWRPLEFMFPAK